ncbi:hypothetical protein HELRODRAFT_173488 [Helobdella robusta]|uniref:RING-type domain-containing protein n=1 Tax=Helobdella robusta TaxID=6412 RepID=T1F6V7_HELRO|nr:hypothetical protein HELRODRAFT_173488 [Helobdella robusta]ESO03785.1 hypothetical protein HELRODRAFT_173488 [Helobdella robusta]
MDITDISDYITCRKCKNVFVFPKILKCSHTFCVNCLNKLLQECKKDDDERGVFSSSEIRKISCPTCKKNIKLGKNATVNDLKPNYFIEELISVKRNLPTDVKIYKIRHEADDITVEAAPLVIEKYLRRVDERLKMLKDDGGLLQQRFTVFMRDLECGHFTANPPTYTDPIHISVNFLVDVVVKIKLVIFAEFTNEKDLIGSVHQNAEIYKDKFGTQKILNRITKIEIKSMEESLNDCCLYKNYVHFIKNIQPQFEEFFAQLSHGTRNVTFPKLKCVGRKADFGKLKLVFPSDKYKVTFRNETKIVKVIKTCAKPRTIAYRSNRNQLFVLLSNSSKTEILIYKCSNYAKLDMVVEMNQVQNANDAVVVDNFLFISSRTEQFLYKVDCSVIDAELMKPNPRKRIEIYQTSGWIIPSYNDGLTKTDEKTLLISCNQTNEIIESGLTSCCMRRVKLSHRSITNPKQAFKIPDSLKSRYEFYSPDSYNKFGNNTGEQIETDSRVRKRNKYSDYYVVSVAGALHKCLIVNSVGDVIVETSPEVNFKYPVSLACHHRNKNGDVMEMANGEDLEIIVCDRMKNRLWLFDMDLNPVKLITPLFVDNENGDEDGHKDGGAAVTQAASQFQTDINNFYKFKSLLKVLLIKNDDDDDDCDDGDDDDELSLAVVDEDNYSVVIVKPLDGKS